MTSRNGKDDHNNQLNYPHGLGIDDDNQSIVIAGSESDRSVDWKMGENNGKVIAGSQVEGNQLFSPTDVFIGKETNSLLIADRGNRQVLRGSRLQGTTKGKVIVDSIDC